MNSVHCDGGGLQIKLTYALMHVSCKGEHQLLRSENFYEKQSFKDIEVLLKVVVWKGLRQWVWVQLESPPFVESQADGFRKILELRINSLEEANQVPRWYCYELLVRISGHRGLIKDTGRGSSKQSTPEPFIKELSPLIDGSGNQKRKSELVLFK